MNLTETCEAAVNCFGKDFQCDIALEEMAELSKAILKERRFGTPQAHVDVIEEIVDCIIILEQQKIIFINTPEARQIYKDILHKKQMRLNQTIVLELEQREIKEQYLAV